MNNQHFDFQIERVNISNIRINASQQIGMVIAQPRFSPTIENRFKLAAEFRHPQIGAIEHAFTIRQSEQHERGISVPFILFPEYAIPTTVPDGLATIDAQLQRTQDEVIFIGGLEGLTIAEAQTIIGRYNPSNGQDQASSLSGNFVNLCVIAIRNSSGEINWYFQAKLFPTQWEQSRNMARGNRVLYFSSGGIRFICQICFDHMAADGNDVFNGALCQKLSQLSQDSLVLDYVFVPQFNEQPLHNTMLRSTNLLLNYQSRGFNTALTAVIFVNVASETQESNLFGKCSVHYRTGRWQIPENDIGPVGYEFREFENISSAIFRKRTETVHVATFIPPTSNVDDNGNPRRPLENVRSYLISDACDSTPCGCEPATNAVGRYINCDCLPCKLRDSIHSDLATTDERRRWESGNGAYSLKIRQNYTQIRAQLLRLACPRAKEIVMLLLQQYGVQPRWRNPDLWEGTHHEAMIEFFSFLSIFDFNDIDFGTFPQWTAIFKDSLALVVLDGDNERYLWRVMVADYLKQHKYQRTGTINPTILIAALRSNGLIRTIIEEVNNDYTKPERPDSIDRPTPQKIFACQGSLSKGVKDDTNAPTFFTEQIGGLLG